MSDNTVTGPPVNGFIQFSGPNLRGGPLDGATWTLVGIMQGDIPPSFTAQPARYNFGDLQDLNGEFRAYIAEGTVTITYIRSPGTTIVGPAPGGSYSFQGVMKVIQSD
ncbi:hypothetical protein AX14_008753 [Amanita brunnescens Koide BX004]|nr:hypothetical protein AX14_008753 [Amanita brunnescens Koide BX004]